MNIDALIVIGAFTFLLGAILMPLGLWWVRREVNRLPENAPGRKKVTLLGLTYYAVFITALMSALSLIHLAPELSWGQLLAIQASVVIIGIAVEKIAYKLGFKFVE